MPSNTNAQDSFCYSMPREKISELLLKQLEDRKAHFVQDLVKQVMTSNPGVYENEIKSTVLGLVRRNQLSLTDGSKGLLAELIG